MLLKDRLTTSKGKLNSNWRKILIQEPFWMDVLDQIDDKYDLKTKVKLVYNGMVKMAACKTCGNDVKTIGATYCSKKCSANDSEVKAKQLQKIDTVSRGKKIGNSLRGRGDLVEKSWKTRRKLYGTSGISVEGLSNSFSEENNAKRIGGLKKTCLEVYGVENYATTDDFRKWASDNQHKSQNSRNHIAPWVYNKEEFLKKYSLLTRQQLMDEGNFKSDLYNSLCIEYGIRDKYQTAAELELKQFIESFNLTVITNSRRIIAPLELDIYVPELKLAIEYNGLYWHSSSCKKDDQYFKNKHLIKTQKCEELGITLLHIFEDEWLCRMKQEIWKSVIKSKLKLNERLYARKTINKDIPKDVAKKFCIENHLQGWTSAKFCRGLYYNDELVMVATFGKSRFKDDNLELIRLCSKKGINVVGGASKITKGLNFVSYANRRWSSGGVYNSLGMKLLCETPPNYWYFSSNKGVLESRQKYMKHKLSQKFKMFDPLLTEVENCYNNNMRRIWDCGNFKFEK